jgi:catechol-2,3-dioxygenase
MHLTAQSHTAHGMQRLELHACAQLLTARQPTGMCLPPAPAQQQAAIPPFHIAFPVRDVEEARQFYTGTLGCSEGRSAQTWVDFNLYGHQVG